MAAFFDREREFIELSRIAAEPGAQMVMVYGRRRVGKTTLLTTWAQQSRLPTFYWIGKREHRTLLMANLAHHLRVFERGSAPLPQRPADWDAVLSELAQVVGDRRCVVILDELPYLIESDPAFLSYLQAAWDQRLRHSQIRLFLSGSHIGMMTRLLDYQAPLYGRFTAQLPVESLGFAQLAHFLPDYDVHKRLAVFAVLGGVPAYLERWRAEEPLSANIERLFLQRTGWFRAEPMLLISDVTRRETEGYAAVLRAIAEGRHARDEIASATEIATTALGHYLTRLMELGLIQRRIPATVPPAKRKTSKESRYHLLDPYLRFHYRFIEPNLHLIEQGFSQKLWAAVQEQFRAFVAETFEDLARAWVTQKARVGALPLAPDVVGSHWSKDVQIDVVAVDFRAKQVLFGEAKWGAGKVGREIIRDLITRAPRVMPLDGWRVHYAFFAREGFTDAARAEAHQHGALLQTLAEMEPALG